MVKLTLKTLESALNSIFPAYSDKIRLILQEDQIFAEIAEDYLFCRQELSRLIRFGKDDLINQYRQIINDLEEEIMSYLNPTKQTKQPEPNNLNSQ